VLSMCLEHVTRFINNTFICREYVALVMCHTS